MGKTRIKFTMNKNLKNADKWLEQLGDTKGLQDRILRKSAYDLGLRISQYTPSRTNALNQSLIPGAPKNYCKITLGKTSVLVFGTTLDYAAAVEYGYDQRNRVNKESGKKPSLWVPGFWSSGTFHYVKYAKEKGFKGGMLLTGRIVEGSHMFDKGTKDFVELDLPRIVKEQIIEWYNSF